MVSTNSSSSNSNLINGTKIKKDKLMQTLLNFGVIVFVVIIIILVYKYVIAKDYLRLRVEGFADSTNIPFTTIPSSTSSTSSTSSSIKTTIYETSLNNLYGDNTRLICGILPTLGKSICQVNNTPFVIYKFPIHIIKLNDSSILAVFNDGRLYQKDSMKSTMWKGPINNSMPKNVIPLRMIMIASDLSTLLGVGYDNILYIKASDATGNLNLTVPWKQVPNNSNIIYILYDNNTNLLVSIDINGKLFIKSTHDITSDNSELVTKLDRPVLRLYYDLNGYMLALDTNFDLYQFSDINWKQSSLNTERGANSSKIQDILYDNDGKMFGLIFNPDSFMVQIMRQSSVFYLSNFTPLDLQITSETTAEFVMSDQDIIKCKIGSLYDYLNTVAITDTTDDDTNFAYQKQIIQSQADLRKFCSSRGSVSINNQYDNYDLLSNVEKNDDKIENLQIIAKSLLSYEPNRDRIIEKYPIVA
jgi:hypothetical protein